MNEDNRDRRDFPLKWRERDHEIEKGDAEARKIINNIWYHIVVCKINDVKVDKYFIKWYIEYVQLTCYTYIWKWKFEK